jgi:hypothetical protein
MMHIKVLERQEQGKHKISSDKEIIIITEISEMEAKRKIQRIDETKT